MDTRVTNYQILKTSRDRFVIKLIHPDSSQRSIEGFKTLHEATELIRTSCPTAVECDFKLSGKL